VVRNGRFLRLGKQRTLGSQSIRQPARPRVLVTTRSVVLVENVVRRTDNVPEREVTLEELELLYALDAWKKNAENNSYWSDKYLDDNIAQYDKLQTARKVVAFFASVIKSGEGWSDTCQQMLDSLYPNDGVTLIDKMLDSIQEK
jgi:hypothetical protein